jgi:two-component system sensor histidine kinase BaeS
VSGADSPPVRIDRFRGQGPRLELKRTPGGLSVVAQLQTGFMVRQVHLALGGTGVPLRLLDGSTGDLYLLDVPVPEETARTAHFLSALDTRILQVAAIAAAVAILFTWVVARQIANPLRELDRAVRDVGEGRLERRVKVSGAGEIAALEHRFNAMAEELGRQQQLRRDLASDVAHELRAPLTGMRCRLEALIDGLTPSTPAALAAMQEDLVHLSRLVDDLQELANAEAKEIRLQCATISIAPLLHSAVRAAGLEGDPRVQFEVAPDLAMYGDEIRMRQVVVNLLTNAERYARGDGSIAIRAAAEGGDVVIEVSNSGSALEPAQLERMFDRFYRTDPARQRSTGGTGLGLAIVKSLVEAHGGRVWAKSSAGTVTLGMRFPAQRYDER